MQKVIVDISLTAEQYLAHYQGAVKDVIALSRDGRRVRFPSSLLQPTCYITELRGVSRLVLPQDGKFQSIERL